MKCVCGYEKIGYDFVDGEYIDVDSNKAEFIKVTFTGDVKIASHYSWQPAMEVQVFACPECGTLKIDIN